MGIKRCTLLVVLRNVWVSRDRLLRALTLIAINVVLSLVNENDKE